MKDNTQLTKLMLTGGIIAGPIYIIVGLAQILTREGFDMTRHPLSLMSLGDLGWIQITNFIVTGFLVLLAAIALRPLAQADKRLRRGAFLIGLYAVSVIGGGIFVTDSALGFPPRHPRHLSRDFQLAWSAPLHCGSNCLSELNRGKLCIRKILCSKPDAKMGNLL